MRNSKNEYSFTCVTVRAYLKLCNFDEILKSEDFRVQIRRDQKVLLKSSKKLQFFKPLNRIIFSVKMNMCNS